MKQKVKRNDLIYPELSYKVTGILFNVFKELGPGYQEKYYQKAIAHSLRQNSVTFEEQVPITLTYDSLFIGRYFLDFLIENVIVLEIKKGNYFKTQNIDQVFGYLKAKNLQLGAYSEFYS